MPRKLSEDGLLARQLGVSTRAIKVLGGVERIEAMQPEAKALMLAKLKRCGVAA